MRFISLFSGIEAASVAWESMGWEPVAFSEIDLFPSAILAARFPDVPNLGDITKVDWSEYRGTADVVVGGSPCQAFSIAGKRGGLMDSRGLLMLEYIRAIRETEPKYALWENVPGVLSQDGGRAFGTLLRELDDCGYSLAWRVLDSQFARVPVRDGEGRIVGWLGPVPQRRRRVFLVGCLGSGGGPSAILFEQEGVFGNPESSGEKRKALAEDARQGASEGGEPVIAFRWFQGAAAHGVAPYDDGTTPTLTNSDSHQPAIAFEKASPEIGRGGVASPAAEITSSRASAQQTEASSSSTTSQSCLEDSSSSHVLCVASDHANAEICYDVSPTILSRAYKGGPWIVAEGNEQNK